jgi:lambda repressor-like predicted transcriptional regulator
MQKPKLRLIRTGRSKTTPAKVFGYKTYSFVDKDPVIDELRTVLTKKHTTIKKLSEDSDVSKSTIRNWFYGETKRPQHAPLVAVARAMGYTLKLVRYNQEAGR